MTWQWAAGIAAAACSLWSVRPYVRGILAGQPVSPLSWAIWAVLCWVLLAALWAQGSRVPQAAGGRAPLALLIAETAGATLILPLSLWAAKRRTGRAVIEEEIPPWAVKVIAAAVAVALAVSWFAGPVPAALLLIGVDFTAGGVTVKRLWRKPGTEPLIPWWRYGTGEVLSTASAVGAGWIFWVSSLSGVAVAAAIIATAWKGGVTVSLPQWVLQQEE